MADIVKAGAWVQIHTVVLEAGKRAPQVPEDTQGVPLELRVNGFLTRDAEVGEEVEIETPIGRSLKGILKDPAPSYEHKFGRPVPELQKVGRDLKAILGKKGV
jgi:hypothetical protein